MAANERPQNAVAPKCYKTAVVWVPMIAFVIRRMPIVKRRHWHFARIDALCFLSTYHFAQIPKFHCLIFAVAQYVAPIAFAVDIGDSFNMSQEAAGFPLIAK